MLFLIFIFKKELKTSVKERLSQHVFEHFSFVNSNIEYALKIGMKDENLIHTKNIFEFKDTPDTIMGYIKKDSSVVLLSQKKQEFGLMHFLKQDFQDSEKVIKGVRDRLCETQKKEDILWVGEEAFYIFSPLLDRCEGKIHFLRFSMLHERNEYVTEMLGIISFYTVVLLVVILVIGSFSYHIINKRLFALLELISSYKQGKSHNQKAMEGKDEIAMISRAFCTIAHKMDAVLDDMHTFVAILSPKGEILFTNNTPLVVSKLKFSDVEGKKLSETYWWEYDLNAQEEIDDLIERCIEGEIINHETQIQIADARLIWIKFSMHPVYDEEGNIEHLVAEGVDISQQKQAYEDMLRQNRKAQMGEMISVIAHQWRQPLSLISSVAGTVLLDVELGTIEDKELKRSMHKLNDTVVHLSSTMAQFTNFFNPNKTSKETSFSVIIKKSVEILGSKLASEGIEIRINIEKEQKIQSFEEELMQVVMDMMKNSADFFKINKITNAQILLEEFIQNDTLCLSIQDNAGGIKDEDLEELFKPYFSTKPQDGGTGLGLHMSKMIVENHCNGRIKVEQLEGGARFIICLPLK
ncbi:PAS domain-containing protein [Sulfurimonas sp. MAG313]|nr:ATP-binding protein [Sulfurimonas sp. MAG313]MDF1879965.1 PAS domain-containing protein [Sulfurimonas sp. MAG313]